MSDTQHLESVLARYWSGHQLPPLQRLAAQTILDGRDSVVVLPGGGAPACYQAPALTRPDGLAAVVAPAISRMQDQVDALSAHGVPVACYHRSLSPEQRRRVHARLRRGRYRILYLRPERLVGSGRDDVRGLLADCGLRYVAIDEAHCISYRVHDFRPDYRRLGLLRDIFPGISLHAFTSATTDRVRVDVVEQLRLRDPRVLIGD
jgi:ATP-dependent DNA helicase RecQ